MKFDRTDPIGGLEIYSALSNGKATLEYKVYLQEATSGECFQKKSDGSSLISPRGGYLDIRMWDRDGELVFCCCHPLCAEEPAKGLLLHPHLWQGTENPYLYRVRVSLMEREDVCTDVLEDTFAFRTFQEIPGKGWFLNDKSFQIRAVSYELSERTSKQSGGTFVCDVSEISCTQEEREKRRERIRRDLELVRKMGANTICPIGGSIDREFCRLCDEAGLLLWWRDEVGDAEAQTAEGQPASKDSGIPRFHGTADSLLTLQEHTLSDRYYFYKACWGRSPFVYISMTSLSLQKNGNAQVTVYSNQKKVALYVDGILFEFRMDGPDFLFQEIPVKSLPILLTAEAGSCNMSVTAYPFTKLS